MMTVDEEIEIDNQRLRVDYLSETDCFSFDELCSVSSSIELILLWKMKKHVFSVYQNDLELFPKFQFKNGEPISIISTLLKRMPADMSRWQIAFWFASPNGFLGGQSPQACLTKNSELVYAVDQESQEFYG